MNKSLYSLAEIEAWEFFTSILDYNCIEQACNTMVECISNSDGLMSVRMMVHGQEIYWFVLDDVFLINGFSSEDLCLTRKQIRRLRKAVKMFRSKEN